MLSVADPICFPHMNKCGSSPTFSFIRATWILDLLMTYPSCVWRNPSALPITSGRSAYLHPILKSGMEDCAPSSDGGSFTKRAGFSVSDDNLFFFNNFQVLFIYFFFSRYVAASTTSFSVHRRVQKANIVPTTIPTNKQYVLRRI